MQIAGFSFGGLIAFEIAQQLRRAGERTSCLCLLDTYVVQDLPRTAWMTRWGTLAWRKLGKLTASEIPGYLAGKVADSFKSRIERMRQPAATDSTPTAGAAAGVRKDDRSDGRLPAAAV